ncbi:MAG TPA: hypothetical protein VMD05_04820 [Candidatus Nanoarchaeia archaeon]|nr:hypothetical protein [Candidatus Nanoarchaeia archaeon]
MSTEANNKPRKKGIYALAALALILGIGAISVGALSFFQNPTYTILSGVKETKITFINTSIENTSQTTNYENKNWTASYEPGKTLTLDESLYTTSDTGVTMITTVISNTPGFVFKESSISLPAFVPYAANISTASERIELTFQTPSTPYTGEFKYTVYYNLTIP